MSIRRKLLFSLLIGLTVCCSVITFIAYFNTTYEMHELFSDDLKRIAIVVKDEVFSKDRPSQKDADEAAFDEPEESSVIQIWNAQGTLLHSSPQAIELPLQPKEGFSRPTINRQKWDVFTLKADNSGFVQVAQPRRMVATMVGESAMRTLLPFTVLFFVLGGGAWFIVGRSLSPLFYLSQLIAGQKVDQLKILPKAETPIEVEPIVNALNELLRKLDQAMNMQLQFMADAAHELRTPLTAVKLQSELLTRAQSPAGRAEAMKKLSEGIDRSVNLASKLLIASRSAAVKSSPDLRTIPVHDIVRLSLATFAPIADAKNIGLTLDPCDEFSIKGDEEGIRAMIDNLIDNAIRYTPSGGSVAVSFCRQDGKGLLKITDAGCGIPENQRSKIFQRFYRMPGTVTTGAGLGLSIVKDVAESHGAVVNVTDGPQNVGTTFRVAFPSERSEQPRPGARKST